MKFAKLFWMIVVMLVAFLFLDYGQVAVAQCPNCGEPQVSGWRPVAGAPTRWQTRRDRRAMRRAGYGSSGTYGSAGSNGYGSAGSSGYGSYGSNGYGSSGSTSYNAPANSTDAPQAPAGTASLITPKEDNSALERLSEAVAVLQKEKADLRKRQHNQGVPEVFVSR